MTILEIFFSKIDHNFQYKLKMSCHEQFIIDQLDPLHILLKKYNKTVLIKRKKLNMSLKLHKCTLKLTASAKSFSDSSIRQHRYTLSQNVPSRVNISVHCTTLAVWQCQASLTVDSMPTVRENNLLVTV